MNKLVVIALALCQITFSAIPTEEEPIMTFNPSVTDKSKEEYRKYEKAIQTGKFREFTVRGLDALIRLASYKLRKDGHIKEGREILRDWQNTQKLEYIRMVYDDRHIGDHGAVIQWLKDKMIMLTYVLGAETVKTTRLSDIRTFNETPKVVFRCEDSVDEIEYALHLVDDPEVYIRGLGPTTLFWVSEVSCMGLSMSSGFLFCGPIASGVEWLSKTLLFPKLNEPMWKRACHQ